MRRRLFNLLTVLSLLLCAAIVAAGVGSYLRVHQITWITNKAAGPRVKTACWDWVIDWGRIGIGREGLTLVYGSAEDALRVEQTAMPEFIHRERPAARVKSPGGSFWKRLGFFYVHERSQSALTNAATPVRGFSSDHGFLWAPLWPFARATAAPP